MVAHLSPCELYERMYQAYANLLAGEATQEIRDGERWRRWHRGDAPALRREVRRLEVLCRGGGSRSATVTGRNPFGPRGPFGRYPY